MPNKLRLLVVSREGPFDVLLTDIGLPDGTAWDLLAALQREGRLPPRVVTMGGSSFEEVLDHGTAYECQAHLEKPFLLEELEAALKP